MGPSTEQPNTAGPTVEARCSSSTRMPPLVSGADVLIRFSSMPGSIHQLERASVVEGGWLPLAHLVVPGNGVAESRDAAPPRTGGFYRTAAP